MRISVICPVYNPDPELLRRAVASVFEADNGDVHELLLVDDVSRKPGTDELLQSLAQHDRRIRVIRRERNGGQSRARNTGMRAATGDWIAFLDNDDLWLPGWPARLRAGLTEAPEARWFAGRHVTFATEGEWRPAPVAPYPSPSEVSPGHRVAEGPALARFNFQNFWVHLGATAIRKDLAAESGGLLDSRAYWEDVHFVTVLATLAPLHLLDIDAYAWRQNPDSHMHSASRLSNTYVAMFAAARADPRLSFMRREVRWSYYRALKGLALDNLLNGRSAAALRYALRAWSLDPREVRDLWEFLRLLRCDCSKLDARELDRYSGMERRSLVAEDSAARTTRGLQAARLTLRDASFRGGRRASSAHVDIP
jgi:GT2 family glycosyltransferase